MILMIDNYDSFTYNIVQYLGELKADVQVVRNNITLEELKEIKFEKLIISPGPCTPKEAGISCEAIKYYAEKLPILGICLGHQSIAEVFGGKVVNSPYLMHGKVSKIIHEGTGVFRDIPSPYIATRYHSLTVDSSCLPDELIINAKTEDDIIMGFHHKTLPIHGVQFHPESILTEYGHKLLENFLII